MASIRSPVAAASRSACGRLALPRKRAGTRLSAYDGDFGSGDVMGNVRLASQIISTLSVAVGAWMLSQTQLPEQVSAASRSCRAYAASFRTRLTALPCPKR